MQTPYAPRPNEPEAHDESAAPSGDSIPTLVDPSFQTFVTPAVAGVLLVVGMIVGALAAVAAVVTGTFANEPLTRAMIMLPVYLVWLVVLRLVLEATVVLFRIEEHLRVLALRQR